MDAWAADPENWNPKPFMDELDRVPVSGCTLAFHDGQLTNLAHGYQHTGQVSDAVFAGYICEHTDDSFLVDVRNRLDPGDVLEFVLPGDDIRREHVIGTLNHADKDYGA